MEPHEQMVLVLQVFLNVCVCERDRGVCQLNPPTDTVEVVFFCSFEATLTPPLPKGFVMPKATY